MKKIYIFGNPLVKDDNVPLVLLSWLKKKFPRILFKVADPNENFPPKKEKELIILDTVKGVKKPQVFSLNDIDRNYKLISPHDYDLGVHLLLLKKLKKIGSAKIIGVPEKMSKQLYSQLFHCINIMK